MATTHPMHGTDASASSRPVPAVVSAMCRSAVVLVLILASGCGIIETKPRQSHFNVDNRTTSPITVTLNGIGEQLIVREMTVPAGTVFGFSWKGARGACNGIGAVAVNPDGTELARLSQPLCDGDRWVFDADAEAHLEPGYSPP